jgi:hypothetical protein
MRSSTPRADGTRDRDFSSKGLLKGSLPQLLSWEVDTVVADLGPDGKKGSFSCAQTEEQNIDMTESQSMADVIFIAFRE